MENTSIANVPPKNSVIQKSLRMLFAMMAFEPVIINAIAISLGLGLLLLLNYPGIFPKLGKYHLYLTYTIYALITIQMIRSSTKSLLIPFIALAIAGGGFLAQFVYPDLHFLSTQFLKQLMLLGVVGIGTAIFVMR